MKQVLQHFLRVFAFLAVCISHAAAYAVGPDNSITVRKFEEDPNDARATVDKVMDKGTNKPCALIIVTNDGNLDGFCSIPVPTIVKLKREQWLTDAK